MTHDQIVLLLSVLLTVEVIGFVIGLRNCYAYDRTIAIVDILGCLVLGIFIALFTLFRGGWLEFQVYPWGKRK